MVELTKEEAVRLFHEQWSDMQKELGDCPDVRKRIKFKRDWCEKRFPGERITANCFLCEFLRQKSKDPACDNCPIVWPFGWCSYAIAPSWIYLPISEILALPVREEV